MKLFSILGILVLLVAGCAATPVQMDPLPETGVAVAYQHGHAVVESVKISKVSVTLLKATTTDAFFNVTLTNPSVQRFVFEPANIAANLVSGDVGSVASKVYTVDELQTAGGNSDLAWDGASIVGGAVIPEVVPGGGIVMSVARGFFGLGMQHARRQNTGQEADSQSLAEQYLRKHTVLPGQGHSGVIQIALPRPPRDTDTLMLSITTPLDQHRISYSFKSNQASTI